METYSWQSLWSLKTPLMSKYLATRSRCHGHHWTASFWLCDSNDLRAFRRGEFLLRSSLRALRALARSNLICRLRFWSFREALRNWMVEPWVTRDSVARPQRSFFLYRILTCVLQLLLNLNFVMFNYWSIYSFVLNLANQWTTIQISAVMLLIFKVE